MTTCKAKRLVALPVLMLCTVAANAATDLEAIEACSGAIATSFVNEQGEPAKVRIDQSVIDVKRRISRSTVFHLDIVDSSSTSILARYDCIVDRRANVRKLKRLPIEAPSAKERSEI